MVKFRKMALTGLASAVLAFALFGCQGQEPRQEDSAPTVPSEAMEVNDRQKEIAESFYVLIVGNDSRVGSVSISDPYYADGSGRSDTMMVARVDPENYQITFVTIPRDTACSIDGETYKINEAYHIGGIEGAITQVESLTGVTIKYYLDTGFVGFQDMINGWGGVSAQVPIEFTMNDGLTGEKVTLSPGEQVLDGKGALALARMRKDYPDDQDAWRQIQDRKLVENAIKQTAEDPARVAGDVATLLANADTNWPKEELIALAADFAAHFDELSFYSGTGPYKGGIDESAGGQWLATRDEAAWREIMKVVDDGGDPTTVLPLPSM